MPTAPPAGGVARPASKCPPKLLRKGLLRQGFMKNAYLFDEDMPGGFAQY
jgi:hypothetical protein